TPLVVRTVEGAKPGRALDLACGGGRNAIWLAEHGWQVTALDRSADAIDLVRERGALRGLSIGARVSDLEKNGVEGSEWDLILTILYLQRDLFEPAMRALAPGGLLIAIVHVGEEETEHRLRPGQLARYFDGYEILHSREGEPEDVCRHRWIAEIVVRKP